LKGLLETLFSTVPVKEVVIIFNNNDLRKAKEKLNLMLTDRQKAEIEKKLKNVDRNELLNMLSSLDLSKQNVDIEKLIENADIENIIKRL
jgi:hypothetical protein